jgi:hypothetical protein
MDSYSTTEPRDLSNIEIDSISGGEGVRVLTLLLFAYCKEYYRGSPIVPTIPALPALTNHL